MKRLTAAILIAFLLWFVMFSQLTAPHLNFWGAMTFSACILIVLSRGKRRKEREGGLVLSKQAHAGKQGLKRFLPPLKTPSLFSLLSLLVATAIASFLFLFWIGNKLSQEFFNFARPQVDTIYQMKDGTPSWLIALLLLFIIGPAEELFWRGYVQRTLSRRWSANVGFVVSTLIYTAVHLSSMNFMLIMAALPVVSVGDCSTVSFHSTSLPLFSPTPCGMLPPSYGSLFKNVFFKPKTDLV